MAALALGFAVPAAAQDDVALKVTVVPRILDAAVQVIWEQTLRQETRAGKPVVVNVAAGALRLRLTITPFVTPDGNYLLVVQGLVRQSDVGGESLRTTVQSLVVPPGERVVYFPLGRDRRGSPHQMLVEIHVDRSDE